MGQVRDELICGVLVCAPLMQMERVDAGQDGRGMVPPGMAWLHPWVLVRLPSLLAKLSLRPREGSGS